MDKCYLHDVMFYICAIKTMRIIFGGIDFFLKKRFFYEKIIHMSNRCTLRKLNIHHFACLVVAVVVMCIPYG